MSLEENLLSREEPIYTFVGSEEPWNLWNGNAYIKYEKVEN